jgi:hypothetical protein
LRWNPLFVDETLHTIFFCFNSSEKAKWAKANWAKGFVTERQRRQRAEDYEVQVGRRPKIRDFFKIALVHHHPYEYGSVPTALYERFLAQFFGGDQRPTKFLNADEFMQWCATRGVSLVLHGHKHVPHWLIRSVDTPRGPQEITVVGCGSSTGVDARPMCYDIVTIDPARKRCNVAFYQDEKGDGAGFELQNVAIDLSPSYNQDVSSEEPSRGSARARQPGDQQELRSRETEDKRHRLPDPADTPQRTVFVSYPKDIAKDEPGKPNRIFSLADGDIRTEGNSGMPRTYTDTLFGRDKEIAQLFEAWDSGLTRVIAYDAIAGQGKTALVRKFFELMASNSWRGARRFSCGLSIPRDLTSTVRVTLIHSSSKRSPSLAMGLMLQRRTPTNYIAVFRRMRRSYASNVCSFDATWARQAPKESRWRS